MRISVYDRLNALIRSKLYQSDYSAYVKKRGDASDFYVGDGPYRKGSIYNYHLSLSKAGKELCKKWGLVYPVDPCAKQIEDYLCCLNRPIDYMPDPSQWKTSQANTFVGGDDKIFTHINGKLALLIDLSFSRKELRSEFDRFLDRWGEKQKKGRQDIHLNKWEVYDKKHKEGKSLLEITRIIFNIKNHADNHPSYSKTVNSNYQQVKRANRSAIAILKNVEDIDP